MIKTIKKTIEVIIAGGVVIFGEELLSYRLDERNKVIELKESFRLREEYEEKQVEEAKLNKLEEEKRRQEEAERREKNEIKREKNIIKMEIIIFVIVIGAGVLIGLDQTFNAGELTASIFTGGAGVIGTISKYIEGEIKATLGAGDGEFNIKVEAGVKTGIPLPELGLGNDNAKEDDGVGVYKPNAEELFPKIAGEVRELGKTDKKENN
jgi:hypothetical protein